jgi:hypothetical protein
MSGGSRAQVEDVGDGPNTKSFDLNTKIDDRGPRIHQFGEPNPLAPWGSRCASPVILQNPAQDVQDAPVRPWTFLTELSLRHSRPYTSPRLIGLALTKYLLWTAQFQKMQRWAGGRMLDIRVSGKGDDYKNVELIGGACWFADGEISLPDRDPGGMDKVCDEDVS